MKLSLTNPYVTALALQHFRTWKLHGRPQKGLLDSLSRRSQLLTEMHKPKRQQGVNQYCISWWWKQRTEQQKKKYKRKNMKEKKVSTTPFTDYLLHNQLSTSKEKGLGLGTKIRKSLKPGLPDMGRYVRKRDTWSNAEMYLYLAENSPASSSRTTHQQLSWIVGISPHTRSQNVCCPFNMQNNNQSRKKPRN